MTIFTERQRLFVMNNPVKTGDQLFSGRSSVKKFLTLVEFECVSIEYIIIFVCYSDLSHSPCELRLSSYRKAAVKSW